MPTHLEITKEALRKHLKQCGLEPDSVARVVDEDLTYLTEWLLNPSAPEELKTARAIIAFSFGFGPKRGGIKNPAGQYYPELYKPGKSNEAMASVIAGLYKDGLQLPVFSQWEIAEALKEYEIVIPINQVARPGGKYLGTSGVVEQMLDNGLNELTPVILVAQPYHMFRCKEITKKISEKRGTALETLIANTSSVPFDPESEQWWTRSLKDWVRYEIGNRFSNRYNGFMGNK